MQILGEVDSYIFIDCVCQNKTFHISANTKFPFFKKIHGNFREKCLCVFIDMCV